MLTLIFIHRSSRLWSILFGSYWKIQVSLLVSIFSNGQVLQAVFAEKPDRGSFRLILNKETNHCVYEILRPQNKVNSNDLLLFDKEPQIRIVMWQHGQLVTVANCCTNTKVKLSLWFFVTEHHAIKVYWGVEV